MVSAESVSLAAELLRGAASLDPTDQDQRLERNLLIAAALREVLTREPVVVGGTAEDYWTADEYHETDLDLVTWSLTDGDKAVLSKLGFRPAARLSRVWIHSATGVPVEFPESSLAGDPLRVRRVPAGSGIAPIIGVEDLYLDRVRQSTMAPDDTGLPTYKSALAIAATNYEQMDWSYIDEAIRGEREARPSSMERIDRRIRRKLRRSLTEPKGPRRAARGKPKT